MKFNIRDAPANPSTRDRSFIEHNIRYNPESRLSFILTIVLLVLFFPPESSFFVSDLRMTLERTVLISIAPIVFGRFFQKMGSGQYRFVASDLFVPLATIGMFVGPAVTFGLADSLKHSGPVAMEFIVSYMATRVLLVEKGQSLAFIGCLCVIISFVAIDGALDTITGHYITREMFGNLTGFTNLVYNEDSRRFGLLRASGPLEHPILFGFTCVIGLLLAAATEMKWKKFCIAACSMGAAISFSSAPQQCLVLGIALLMYGRLFRNIRGKWILLATGPVLAAVALFVATPSPFGHIFDLLTFNPETAYYRLFIWQSVGPAILDNPFFSVLPSATDYEGSVDSVWLLLALTYGMLCSILTGLSMIGACSLPTEQSRANLSDTESRVGTTLSIIIFLIIFMGFTVDFWGEIWILIGLLVGLRAHLGELGRLETAAPTSFIPAQPEISARKFSHAFRR